MKKINRWLHSIFETKQLQNIDLMEILDAMNDPGTRKFWLWDVCEELKRINLEIDKRLVMGNELKLNDLAARRRAYQDVLEGVLLAKRTAKSQFHNPLAGSEGFDLENVTVKTSPY